MHEVDKDMNATDVFIDFLDAIEDKTKSADENRQIANIQRGTKNNSSEDLNKKRFWSDEKSGRESQDYRQSN